MEQEIQSHSVIARDEVVFSDEDGVFSVDVMETNGVKEIFCHLTLNNWNSDVYDKVLVGLDTFSKAMKEHGIDNIFIMIPPDDEKMLKFEEMIGFELYQYVTDKDKNITALKLKYEG